MNYELKIAEFEGPLGKLLELIEEKKLEVTRFNLAEVTADFLRYLETLKETDPRTIAEFVAVAAKLILIKSHALLPQIQLSEEEEEEAQDLETRLKLYREFKTAEINFKPLWFRSIAYSRDYLNGIPQGFYLNEKLEPEDLLKRMVKLTEDLAIFFPKSGSAQIKIINLEEKIKELIIRVDKVFKTSFNEVTRDKQRSEVVALFLALLHLFKDNLIKINQSDGFSDIEILSVKKGELSIDEKGAL